MIDIDRNALRLYILTTVRRKVRCRNCFGLAPVTKKGLIGHHYEDRAFLIACMNVGSEPVPGVTIELWWPGDR